MKKAVLTWLLAACVLMMTCALSEGLEPAEPIKGSESAGAPQAPFLVAYEYPQFKAQYPADENVNAYYRKLADGVDAALYEADASISCEVTHNSDRYLSVLETTTLLGGNGETQRLRADTFARDGMYAGQKIGLSQLLGLEEQADVAARLACELVWQMVERDAQNPDAGYLDGVTREQVEAAFVPEWDYYVDGDGNVVFFIQAGEIASEMAGCLAFPFSVAEMMSAM